MARALRDRGRSGRCRHCLIASEKLADPKLDELHYRALLEDFAADPVGLREPPPGFLELAEKLKGEPVAPLLLNPPKDGAPNPMSAMLQHLLGDKAEALSRAARTSDLRDEATGDEPAGALRRAEAPAAADPSSEAGVARRCASACTSSSSSAEANRLRAMGGARA